MSAKLSSTFSGNRVPVTVAPVVVLAVLLATWLGVLATPQPARGVTLRVEFSPDAPAPPMEVANAWANYAPVVNNVLTINGGATMGAPGVISFKNADIDDLAAGIFDAASVGPGGAAGRVIFNAEARARNYGGRSGALALTNLIFSSSVPDPITFRVTVEEMFPVDAAWLGNLPPGTQYGWASGVSGTFQFNDQNQFAKIASVGGRSSVNGDLIPIFGAEFTQLAPLTAGPAFLDFADAPIPNPMTGAPPAVMNPVFPVKYVVDLTLSGGSPNNKVEIQLQNSLDGLGVGNGFGDKDSPLVIPEPNTIFMLMVGALWSFHQRRFLRGASL